MKGVTTYPRIPRITEEPALEGVELTMIENNKGRKGGGRRR